MTSLRTRSGGSAVYSVIAYLLVLIALTMATTDRIVAALLTTILAVNSALHAGVGLVARGSIYNVAHTALWLGLALLWLFCVRDGWRRMAAVPTALGTGLLVGVVTAAALGSQPAVQNSGLYGVGRLLAVALAVLALNRRRFFWSRPC